MIDRNAPTMSSSTRIKAGKVIRVRRNLRLLGMADRLRTGQPPTLSWGAAPSVLTASRTVLSDRTSMISLLYAAAFLSVFSRSLIDQLGNDQA